MILRRQDSSIGGENVSRERERYESRSTYPLSWRTLGLLLLAGVAFLSGRLSGQHKTLVHGVDLQVISRTFHYDEVFAGPSSNATNEAWQSIYPSRGTFFTHAPLAPERSTFSVFHLLHCLDGIRQGYWAMYDAATEGRPITSDEIPMMGSVMHVKHCTDLLRQSLMCRPDLTIEVKDETRGGVTGFGTRHQCEDWAQLIDLVTEWQRHS